MSANRLSVMLAILWLVWVAVLSRYLGISWVPSVPMLFFIGLGAAFLLNSLASPAGVAFLLASLVLPTVSTIQILFCNQRKR